MNNMNILNIMNIMNITNNMSSMSNFKIMNIINIINIMNLINKTNTVMAGIVWKWLEMAGTPCFVLCWPLLLIKNCLDFTNRQISV